MFHKHLLILLSIAIFSSNIFIPLVEAGHHHGNNDHGLAVLLAAGLLAKILRHHKHEEHHVHIPVPVHEHHEHHGHHGSGTTRIIVHHPPPFHNIHGGMLPAPSMIQRYVYPGAPQGYPNPPY